MLLGVRQAVFDLIDLAVVWGGCSNCLPFPWRFPEVPAEICERGKSANSGNFFGNMRALENYP